MKNQYRTTNKGHIHIKEIDYDLLEVDYLQHGEESSLSWTIRKEEVSNLIEWWQKEGKRRTESDAPILNYKFKSILITMHSPLLLLIGRFDKQGRKLINGFILDSEVIELLSGYSSEDAYLCELLHV